MPKGTTTEHKKQLSKYVLNQSQGFLYKQGYTWRNKTNKYMNLNIISINQNTFC